jgi:hypothetical protein
VRGRASHNSAPLFMDQRAHPVLRWYEQARSSMGRASCTSPISRSSTITLRAPTTAITSTMAWPTCPSTLPSPTGWQ